jgi:hypothetical protein
MLRRPGLWYRRLLLCAHNMRDRFPLGRERPVPRCSGLVNLVLQRQFGVS